MLKAVYGVYMATIKPSWYYEKQAAEAAKRETYYRTARPPKPPGTAVVQRPTRQIYYRSLNQKANNESIIYSMQANEAALTAVTAAKAGITTTAPTGTTDIVLPRPKGFFPTRANWYKGTATPATATTPYQTSYPRYYDKAAGVQSHFSIPMSMVTGEVTVAGIKLLFDAIFNPGGVANTTLLGTKNGRASLTLEKSRGAAILT